MTNRRNFIKQISAAGLIGLFPGAVAEATVLTRNCRTSISLSKRDIFGNLRLRGPFPILSTPYLESGKVDYEILAKEAKFVAECGCPGMIWPQSDDSCDLLSVEEKLEGMEAITRAMVGSGAIVVLGCQGKNTEEMIVCAEHIEKLAARYGVAVAVISRPPDNGRTEDDLKYYYLELARHLNRPVIIQTGGGTAYKGAMPPVKLLIDLAECYPDIFGYIKEESGDCNRRIVEEIDSKPIIKTVFSAWGSYQWLYQSRQLGTEGVITERAVYADILAYIWEQMENGDVNGMLNDAFSKYILMLNLSQSVSDNAVGGDLRGPHLYLLKKRGIFKNCLSRGYIKKDGKRIIPDHVILKDLEISQSQIDEIESRFDSLKPYLRK